MKRAVVLLIVLFTLPAGASSQWWSFSDRNYYVPHTAGVREPQLSAMAVGLGDRVAFQVSDDDPRVIWDIDIGTELPIVGWETSSPVDQMKRVPPGETGIGFWIPVDFHLLLDHSDDSGPPVNTDYRFGGTLKVQRGLSDSRWAAIRLAIGHESTHLGDEFTIHARRNFPRTFERINVSWEFADLGVMYEDFGGAVAWSARGGVTRLIWGDSYYQVDPASVTISPQPVTPSTNNSDYYIGFDAELEAIWFNDSWGPYASAELRNRSIYDYHKADPDAPEDRQLSVNVIFGLKKSGAVAGIGRAAPFIRYYRGVNPHGQFRNQPDYVEYGIGMRLVR